MKTFELKVDDEGNLTSIYNDDFLDLYNQLGCAIINRASDVEFENEVHGWTVRSHARPELALRTYGNVILASDKDLPLAVFKTREEALEAEIKNFWDILEK